MLGYTVGSVIQMAGRVIAAGSQEKTLDGGTLHCQADELE